MIELFQNYFAQAPAFGWNAFWISQGFILLALCSDIISYQMKKREHLLAFFVVSTVFVAVHLFLLGENTAGLLITLAAIRFFVCIFSTDTKIMYGFLFLATLVFFYNYKAPTDILALFCNYLFTIAGFQKSDKHLRQVMMCGTSCWIVFNILIFSPAAVFLESVFLTSNFVGYYRFYIKKKTSSQS